MPRNVTVTKWMFPMRDSKLRSRPADKLAGSATFFALALATYTDGIERAGDGGDSFLFVFF